MEKKRWLNEKEAAEIMSLSVFTLRNWRWQGVGPKFLKPRRMVVRYELKDIEAFMRGEGA